MVPCHHYPSVCATLVLLGSLGSRDKNHMGTPMVPCHSEFHFGVVGYRTNARTKTNVRPENTVLRKRVPGRRPPCGVNTVEYRHVMCDSADRPASRARGDKGERPRTQSDATDQAPPVPGKGKRTDGAQTLAIPRSKPHKLRKGKTRSEGRKSKSGKAPTVIHTGLAQESCKEPFVGM